MNVTEVINEFSTIRDFVRWAVSNFNAANLVYGHGADNAWDEAVQLVLASVNLTPDMDNQILSANLTKKEKELIAQRVKLRVEKRIPTAYLIKEAWFANYSFYVDERVIIPKSPIAELLEEELKPWVDQSKVKRVLDLCAGSGCIGISCALTFPEAQVDLVDIDKDALNVAKENIERYDVEDRVNLIESDLFTKLTNQKYDVIISNPPYVSQKEYDSLPEEYKHEPKQALLGGKDGLDFASKILTQSINHLNPDGILVCELGYSKDEFEKKYNNIPFTWLQFQKGGEGVFLLNANELQEFQSHFKDSTG